VGEPAIVLVTGSRQFTDQQRLDQALNAAWNQALARGFTDLVVVHGGARGADKLADSWARRRQNRGVSSRCFRADWDGPCTAECKPGHRRPKRGGTYCPAEGNRRNQRMVEHVLGVGVPGGVLALAFFVEGLPCDGTRDCLRRVKAAGLPFQELLQPTTTAVGR
jgi:hypothetical protein